MLSFANQFSTQDTRVLKLQVNYTLALASSQEFGQMGRVFLYEINRKGEILVVEIHPAYMYSDPESGVDWR